MIAESLSSIDRRLAEIIEQALLDLRETMRWLDVTYSYSGRERNNETTIDETTTEDMNLATKTMRKLTKITNVFTSVIISFAIDQKNAIVINDFEKKIVSDLSFYESKLVNMKRSRISCESKISRRSLASWSRCFVVLALVSWSWEKNDRSSETNSSTRKRFSSTRENNSRTRRASSVWEKTTCFRCASLFLISLKTIASSVIITRKRRNAIFATIRKQFIFMFFKTDQICNRYRRTRVRL
jgi:hypothetical protein